ncbi:MAG: hypothetical protein M0R51_17965 [Clostridia bacterium]|jgi:hypothetical protein|nr:hypothetical protein [Clostridia bacterium]
MSNSFDNQELVAYVKQQISETNTYYSKTANDNTWTEGFMKGYNEALYDVLKYIGKSKNVKVMKSDKQTDVYYCATDYYDSLYGVIPVEHRRFVICGVGKSVEEALADVSKYCEIDDFKLSDVDVFKCTKEVFDRFNSGQINDDYVWRDEKVDFAIK